MASGKVSQRVIGQGSHNVWKSHGQSGKAVILASVDTASAPLVTFKLKHQGLVKKFEIEHATILNNIHSILLNRQIPTPPKHHHFRDYWKVNRGTSVTAPGIAQLLNKLHELAERIKVYSTPHQHTRFLLEILPHPSPLAASTPITQRYLLINISDGTPLLSKRSYERGAFIWAEHVNPKLQETLSTRRPQFCSQNRSAYSRSRISQGVPERGASAATNRRQRSLQGARYPDLLTPTHRGRPPRPGSAPQNGPYSLRLL